LLLARQQEFDQMALMRAKAVAAAGTWDPAREIDRVLLAHEDRHRRRVLLRTVAGREVLLDLPGTERLRQDDGLVCGEAIIRVCAKPEALLEIRARDTALLLRLAWHVGNRHMPVQVFEHALRVPADHVIAGMVEGLGGCAVLLEAAFEPEAGAYSGHTHAEALASGG
jgi:urease accessory protein